MSKSVHNEIQLTLHVRGNRIAHRKPLLMLPVYIQWGS